MLLPLLTLGAELSLEGLVQERESQDGYLGSVAGMPWTVLLGVVLYSQHALDCGGVNKTGILTLCFPNAWHRRRTSILNLGVGGNHFRVCKNSNNLPFR